MRRWAFFVVGLVALAARVWATFERPSEHERLRALGNVFEESETFRALLQVDDEFPPIRRPNPGDWLALHDEKGQTFDEYRASGANRPDATRHVIYLQPLGEFPEENSPSLDEIRTYAAAFFQMEVKVLPT